MIANGGSEFHGEFSSTDATALSEGTTARFALYAPGSTTALTLNSNDYIVVTGLTISSAATNALIQVYSGADTTVDAGEEIFGGIVLTNTTVYPPFNVVQPHTIKGTYLKLKASASGNVRSQVTGYIVRVGS